MASKKIAARRKLNYEVRKGRIPRPDNCSECLLFCKPEAHHPDYEVPLNVIWLCKSCHWDYELGDAIFWEAKKGVSRV